MKQRTRILIYILIAITVVIVGSIAIIANHNANRPVTAQEKIDLGHAYLLDLSYEKAVLEFTEAIKIEPMNADAYLGLAEAYQGMGDIDKAIEALETGYEKTGDQRLKDKLDELFPPEETTVTTTVPTTVTTTETTTTIELVTVPDLAGMTQEEALSICEELGISCDVKTEESDTVEKNHVISQSVAAGANVPVNYAISVTVSEGKKVVTTTVPPVEYITIKGEDYPSDLYWIDLSNKGLTNDDIKDLKKFKNLTGISLDNNYITNLDNLRGLDLNMIIMGDNNVNDISALKDMPNLEVIYMYGNQINDLGPLSELKNLKELGIGNNQVTDLSPLKNLTSLTRLEVGQNRISDISVIGNLTQLEILLLYLNNISDISCLSECTNLKELNLGGNKVSDISPLKKMTDMTTLGLHYNRISDISPLKKLSNLSELDLSYNPLSSEDIEELRKTLPDCKINT